jgi:lipoate-protein ligase A
MMENWRLIIHPPYPGAWNMAVDEAILESVSNKIQPPTLRLYDWFPYTLSLGHAQSYADIDENVLHAKGWDVVRRPTGGRAILHADELTYSICAPVDDPHVSGNVLESYRLLAAGLLKGLELAGIQADSKPKNESEKDFAKNPVCFQYPSDYEITCRGKKLIGSAQARRNQGVLQHGAIPLNGDISRIVTVLSYPDENKRNFAGEQLLERATTIAEIMNRFISWQEMAEFLVRGFEQALTIRLERGHISDLEKSRAFELYKGKYANNQWTRRI